MYKYNTGKSALPDMQYSKLPIKNIANCILEQIAKYSTRQ